MHVRQALTLLFLVLCLMIIAFICGVYFNEPELKIVKKTEFVTVTPTTYLGIKCIVNGYEVETDLQSAEQAGCK